LYQTKNNNIEIKPIIYLKKRIIMFHNNEIKSTVFEKKEKGKVIDS